MALTDINFDAEDVRFEGESGPSQIAAECPLMTQSGLRSYLKSQARPPLTALCEDLVGVCAGVGGAHREAFADGVVEPASTSARPSASGTLATSKPMPVVAKLSDAPGGAKSKHPRHPAHCLQCAWDATGHVASLRQRPPSSRDVVIQCRSSLPTPRESVIWRPSLKPQQAGRFFCAWLRQCLPGRRSGWAD
jgi:hypothetical protein